MSKQMQASEQANRASDLRVSGNASNHEKPVSRFLKGQQVFARAASAFIVASALALTYDGTMTFAQAHGALGWRGALIAAMNDLAVIVGILWPEKPLQALAGLCAGLTIWANLSLASAGPAGIVIALVPPGLAILMVSALESVIRRADREPVSQAASQAEPIGEPVSQPGEPVSQDEPTYEPHPAHFSGSIGPIGTVSLKVVGIDGSVRDPWVSEPEREPLHSVPEPWTKDRVLAWFAADSSRTTAQAVALTGVSKPTINRWKAERAA